MQKHKLPILLIAIMLPALFITRRLSATPPPPSVDLYTYVRVGRFPLPEPTRTPAPANSLLAQEASGVTYNWDTNTLFVVGDGGTSIVQVSKTGALINSMTLAPGGSPQGTEFYDTEGITYVGAGRFVLLEERYRQANLFTYIAGGTLQRADVRTVKLGTSVGNTGLEGLSFDPMTGGFIFVKEKDPQSIFQSGIDFAAGTATNGSPTATSSTNLFDPALTNLADLSDVFALSNLSFLNGSADSSHLLVISQESGQIINVDRSGVVSSRLTITADAGSPLSVPDMTMEGVTMDSDGILYVVNENGGGDASHPELWVFAHSDAPNLVPTGVVLNNAVTSIPENTSTAAPVKLADIVVIDDGLGNNQLSVSGIDAVSFQIIGTGLFLKAGIPLNASSKPSYFVTVNADDLSVGNTPDASTNLTLSVTASTGGTASIIISEVAPWSSGNSVLASDWFELTNVGTATQDITGWKMDDDSNAIANAVALTGITKVAPGESVVFIESATSKKNQFLSLWFGANPPANLQVGTYSGSGVGLGTGGDAVNIFDSTGAKRAGVTVGVSTTTGTLRTFDNGAALNNAPIAALSATGVNGAFSITDGVSTAIGSPGTIGAPATPVVSISTIDASASETGSDSGTFRLTRTGNAVGALAVNFVVTSGAGQAESADYTPTLTGVATISSGQASVDVIITPVDDSLFEGPETLTLTLFDTGSYDVGSPSTASITIADNDPPNSTIVSHPVDRSANPSASFAFIGSEPGSLIARFECSLDGVTFGVCTSPVSYTGLADGSHTFSVRAVDNFGNADPTPASFTWIVDTTPPVITVAASEKVLWPPNGKLVSDKITGVIKDAVSGVDPETVTFRVVDEYGEIQPTGPISLGSNGQFSFTLKLEARRLGEDLDGRRFEVIVSATDKAGNTASGSATVTVPHDKGGQ